MIMQRSLIGVKQINTLDFSGEEMQQEKNGKRIFDRKVLTTRRKQMSSAQ